MSGRRVDTIVGSVRLRARELDRLPPLLGFFCDAPSVFGGREGKDQAAEVGKACVRFGIGERSVDPSVELVDDLARRVLRRADAAPCARLEARHKVAHGRDVGNALQARRRRHC